MTEGTAVNVIRTIKSLYREERWIWRTALLGLALGGVCLVAMAVHGPRIEPEGTLYKAASFDVAVGIYLLTIALMVPLAGFSERGRRIWRWTLVPPVWYGYGIETVQIFRGLDPRFSRVGGPVDQILGLVFFLSALGIFVNFLVLTARFLFRRLASADNAALVLALRYATVAAVLAFSIGIAMSALQGPRMGARGNLLPLHASGFHGLQAVPLVALLMSWSALDARASRRLVHVAGLAWLGFCAAVAWQSFSGRSVLEPSPASVIAAAFLLVYVAIFLRAALQFRRQGVWPPTLASAGL